MPTPARLVPALACLLLAGCAAAPAGHPGAGQSTPVPSVSTEPNAPRRGDAYYLSTCAQCDRPLGFVGPALDVVVGERALRFCAQGCLEAFLNALPGSWTHVDGVVARDQMPHYPITTSIVSGKALGPSPVDLVWCNRLVRLSDEGERARFLASPERFVDALDAEVIRVQSPTYGMPNRCPVQGDILDSDEPIDFVVANRMVRVCCARCVRSVKNRPYQYLALVDLANRQAAEERAPAQQAP